MSQLIWCRYTQANKHTIRLFVELGARDNLVYVLDNSLLGPEEITMIRQATSQIDKLPLDELMEWLKSRIPGAMKAFKTLKADQMTVLKILPLKPL